MNPRRELAAYSSRFGGSMRSTKLIVTAVISTYAVTLLCVKITGGGGGGSGAAPSRFFAGTAAGRVRVPDLDPAEVPVNRSLFFVETNRRPAVPLTVRQACSVESAARANPDRPVYVLFLSPELKCGDDVAAAFSLVTHYRNVRLRHVDLAAYTRDTPVEDFVRSGVMDDGLWPVEQLSDLMRILTLWKFGGVYVDLDVVSLRPMPRAANFIGAEYPGHELLASSAIGVHNKAVAEKAIRMFKDGWDGKNWVKNGPDLWTRLLAELCGTDNVTSMYTGDAKCDGFTVYPPQAFGPVAWYHWRDFFDPSKTQQVMEKINRSVAVHFWNRMTKDHAVVPASRHPYAEIASVHCPIVFGTVVDSF